MATSNKTIPKCEWALISEVSIKFQVMNGATILAVESAVMPTTLNIKSEVPTGQWFDFIKKDGNLYGYSKNVAVELALQEIS